jgi:hypothetical protein
MSVTRTKPGYSLLLAKTQPVFYLLLYFCIPKGEESSNRPSKTHSSSASAANASGFVQISLSQMPQPDTLVD